MKTKLLAVVLSLLGCSYSLATDAPAEAQAECIKIFKALSCGDYAAFVADGDAAFKGITKSRFNAVVDQLSPQMKAGYMSVTYLGELRQRGCQVTLWRLRFSSGEDDLLATLSLKDGKVGGFWIK